MRKYEIVGPTVPFAYPWRLVTPTTIARLTAWSGYLLHNIIVWIIIYRAQQKKPQYGNELKRFNWALIVANLSGIVLHLLQSIFFYDGLAADVPELSALGSVALMLAIVIIIETPRRGLILGKKFKFKDGFLKVVRTYHGYFFSWATIYTFWYHPTENTWGHLLGFFYMFMLFVQSAFIFNRAHINKYWTFFLEFFVLIHGVVIAIFQGNKLWPMFAFGFGAMVVLVQMYGLGLSVWSKRIMTAGFIAVVIAYYGIWGRIVDLNEVIRIPVIDYISIFLLYGIYLAIAWARKLFNERYRPTARQH